MIGYGAINTASHTGPQPATFDPVLTSLSGILVAQLAIGVLGVLVITSEYSTGMIRSTFAAAPQRHLVIAAKAAAFGASPSPSAPWPALIAFLVGQAILGAHGVSLTSPGALRSIIGVGLYLGLLGVFAVALGTIVRRTAGAIAALVGLILILPALLLTLPASHPGHGREVPARQRRPGHLHHQPRQLHPLPLGRPGHLRPLRGRRGRHQYRPGPPTRRLAMPTNQASGANHLDRRGGPIASNADRTGPPVELVPGRAICGAATGFSPPTGTSPDTGRPPPSSTGLER